MEEEKIYLKDGIDTWFELVNQFWYGYRTRDFCSFSFPRSDISSESLLTRITYEAFQSGFSARFHEDATKTHICFLGNLDKYIGLFNELRQKYGAKFPKLDPVERDMAYFDLSYKHSGDIDVPQHLIPKNREPQQLPPILKPFMPLIKRLEMTYAEELKGVSREENQGLPPREEVGKISLELGKLVYDAVRAGESAVYQNVPVLFDQWSSEAYRFMQEYAQFVKSNGVKNAPKFYLVSLSNSHDLMCRDARIHSRLTPPSILVETLRKGLRNQDDSLTEYLCENGQYRGWGFLIWKKAELRDMGVQIHSFFDECKKFKAPRINFSSDVKIVDEVVDAYPLFYKASATALINTYIHSRLQQAHSIDSPVVVESLPENKGLEFRYKYSPEYTFSHESLRSSSGILYSESVEPLIGAWRLEDRSKEGQGQILLLRN